MSWSFNDNFEIGQTGKIFWLTNFDRNFDQIGILRYHVVFSNKDFLYGRFLGRLLKRYTPRILKTSGFFFACDKGGNLALFV